MPIKSVTTDTIIDSLCQVFPNNGVAKVIVSRNATQFFSTRFEDFCRGLNISLLHSPPNLNGLDEQLEIYLNTCDLPPPWNPEIPEIQFNFQPDLCPARFRSLRKRFKADPKLKRMDKQLAYLKIIEMISSLRHVNNIAGSLMKVLNETGELRPPEGIILDAPFTNVVAAAYHSPQGKPDAYHLKTTCGMQIFYSGTKLYNFEPRFSSKTGNSRHVVDLKYVIIQEYMISFLRIFPFKFKAMRVVLILQHLLQHIFSSLGIAYDSEAKRSYTRYYYN
ncbi:hypothetical protein ACTXT7_013784 [Hymenolepis weldensis]